VAIFFLGAARESLLRSDLIGIRRLRKIATNKQPNIALYFELHPRSVIPTSSPQTKGT
jgi:hypothetical protein